MGENTKIQWTDYTFNPWIGCTKVSPGCVNCYAAESTPARVMRAAGHETWGKGATRKRTSEANWKEPVKWNAEAGRIRVLNGRRFRQWSTSETIGRPEMKRICAQALDEGEVVISPEQGEVTWMSGHVEIKPEVWEKLEQPRPRVFCASLSDWLDDEVPIEWLADLLKLIFETPNLDWQLLTKRPQNWKDRLFAAMLVAEKVDIKDTEPYREGTFCAWLEIWRNGEPPANVWLGTTVENQAMADLRITLLLDIPAKVRFLSAEPLLGPVDFRLCRELMSRFNSAPQGWHDWLRQRLHWVIIGGESGREARTCYTFSVRDLLGQCQAAGVPCFVKQLGSSVLSAPEDVRYSMAMKHPKGGDMAEWHPDLQVREFPKL